MIAEMIRKPLFWAVAIPIVLACCMGHAAITLGRCKSDAHYQQGNAIKARRSVQSIKRAEQEMGISDGASSKYFSGFSSALNCARSSQIEERYLSRGESAKPQLQKDGSFLHRETYILDRVYLVQVARFIDMAERNYFSVRCAQLTLSSMDNKKQDNWTASVRLEYITR